MLLILSYLRLLHTFRDTVPGFAGRSNMGGRGPLFEVAAGPQRPSSRAEFSAKGRVPTRHGWGPESRALSLTPVSSTGPKIAPKKKRGGAAGALRSDPGITPTSEGRRELAHPHTNFAA